MRRGRLMDLSVLLVQQDRAVCEVLADHLDRSGFRVRRATSILQAETLAPERGGVVVIDAHMPDGDGLDFGRRLCAYFGCGLILCVEESGKALRITSLRAGADACIVKPVDPEELEATLISVHRRLAASPRTLGPAPVLNMWVLDGGWPLLRAPNGSSLAVSPLEYRLLQILFEHPERHVGRGTLVAGLAAVAEEGYTGARLEALVSRLRAKVVARCGMKLPLASSYGHGYRFNGHVRVLV